jgi:hypothetical protein
VFGCGSGVPNWVGDRLNRIFACDDISIDGTGWMRNDGAKLEATREAGYPFSGWAIELLKVVKEHSDDFDLDYFTVDTTLFTCDNDNILCDKTLI